ncbi:MAG TPA: hypothetical protein VGC31_09945 [Paenirhodobacter sp.]
MDDDTPETKQPKGRQKPASDPREERLRAALRANLQRRKAQARARASQDGEEGQEDE